MSGSLIRLCAKIHAKKAYRLVSSKRDWYGSPSKIDDIRISHTTLTADMGKCNPSRWIVHIDLMQVLSKNERCGSVSIYPKTGSREVEVEVE